jgi:hypothetical protein
MFFVPFALVWLLFSAFLRRSRRGRWDGQSHYLRWDWAPGGGRLCFSRVSRA